MSNTDIRSIYFIGIGGVGMSGIARIACKQGLAVAGSDMRQSRYTDQLVELGATVHIGHDAAHLTQAAQRPDVIVVSTAVLPNNPEYIAAGELGIPIWHRAQMLAYLGRGKQTLAVAGTHGKTTTSSMLATVLDGMGEEPTFLIGGMVRAYGTNASEGNGPFYVVEADESDKSFTYLNPYGVIATNVEPDHLDHYADLDEIYRLFEQFIGSVPEDGGFAVVCAHDERLLDIARKAAPRVITYGELPGCDVVMGDFEPHGVGSTFTLTFADGRRFDASIKQNPGRHNALNAAGVIAMIDALGLDVEKAIQVLGTFAGVRRRFDLVGEAGGITVVDDYAHHPTEINATIRAAKQLAFNRVIVLFQPHRYSRAKLFTDVLHDEFGTAFDGADHVVFMDVYSAGETPVPGISGKTFMATVLDNPNHPPIEYVPKQADTVDCLMKIIRPGDLVITMGAGDVTYMGPALVRTLEDAEAGKR